MTDASTTEAGRWREWPGPAEALEERSCELGGHDEAIQLHVENGFRILRCRQCRHVYVNPRPTRDALSDWYGRFFEALDADGIEGWRRQMSGVFHQAYRLAVPRRLRHPEVAVNFFLRLPPLLVTDDHNRLIAKLT